MVLAAVADACVLDEAGGLRVYFVQAPLCLVYMWTMLQVRQQQPCKLWAVMKVPVHLRHHHVSTALSFSWLMFVGLECGKVAERWHAVITRHACGGPGWTVARCSQQANHML